MPAVIISAVLTGLEMQMLGMGVFEQPKQPFRAQFILFFVINNQGVVISGATKQVTGIEIRGVNIAAWINDQRVSVEVQLETELVVVLMIAESLGTDNAITDQQELSVTT